MVTEKEQDTFRGFAKSFDAITHVFFPSPRRPPPPDDWFVKVLAWGKATVERTNR